MVEVTWERVQGSRQNYRPLRFEPKLVLSAHDPIDVNIGKALEHLGVSNGRSHERPELRRLGLSGRAGGGGDLDLDQSSGRDVEDVPVDRDAGGDERMVPDSGDVGGDAVGLIGIVSQSM